MTTALVNPANLMDALSRLVFSQGKKDTLSSINREQFEEMVSLADSNHVVMRSMDTLRTRMASAHDYDRYEWATEAIERERARIDNAISFLHQICGTLSSGGCNVIVIKSLDHWPDIGS